MPVGEKISQFVERTGAVTAQDVQRVASQYLTADMRTTGTLIPLPPQTQSALPPTLPLVSHCR